MTEPTHTPEIPPGVTPLIWAERIDESKNSHFEALSHVFTEPLCWRVDPVMRENRVQWTVAQSDTLLYDLGAVSQGTWFATPEEAKKHAEDVEIEAGGAGFAPRPLQDNPDTTAPAIADEHGFAPTRKIVARWSRNGGVLYLARVWAKVENPEITQSRDLHGEEYEEALPNFLRQQIVTALVAKIVDGWRVPLAIDSDATGRIELECEMHFVQALALRWEHPADRRARQALPPKERGMVNWRELPPPSHEQICLIVGQQLAEKRDEFEEKMAGTSVAKLQREITKNARSLGIHAEAPSADQETGNVLPITLENMQKEGIDLNGKGLKS